MATFTDKLLEVRDELRAAKDQNQLSNEGLVVLNALEKGGVTPDGLNAFLQGLSLNISDEAIGALRSVFSDVPGVVARGMSQVLETPVTPSQAGAALERMDLSQYRERSPVASFMYELAGGAAPAVLSRGRSVPKTLTSATAKSVPYGFVAGAGAAEGGLMDRLESGGTSAAISAGVTPALQIAGRLLGTGYRGLTNAMFSSPERLGKDEARVALREALQADVGDVDQALAVILNKAGKPYSLADIGPNTRAYLDAVNVLPGPGKQEAKKFLEQRDKGMLSRITSDIQDAFGGRASYFDEFNALKTARSDTGKRLYERAFKKDVPVNSELTQLLKTPSVQRAYNRAVALAQEKGISVPKVDITPDGKLMTKGGEVKSIDTEFLHFLKMGLDGEIFVGKTPTSGIDNVMLNQMKVTRERFLNFIDRNNKAYKTARNYWADDTAAMDAMQMGRKLSQLDPDELAADISRMSVSEKEAFRLGAMQSILDKIGGAQTGETLVASGNAARNLVRDPKTMRLLEKTFGNDPAAKQKFDVFKNKLMDEVDMRTTSMSTLGGSQTAGRLEAVSRIREAATKTTPTKGASVADVVLNALRRDFQGAEDAQLRASANELARMLTETDPAKVQAILSQIEGKGIATVLRKTAPELLPALGRAVIGPYSVSSMIGSTAPTTQQAIPGLLDLFAQ